jgi:hypothetical protein
MVRRCSIAVTLVVTAIVGFAPTPAAGATFSASQITTPTTPTFALWNAPEARSITVAGTTSGSQAGEAADIDCFAAGETVPLETDVPLAANGSFYVLSVSLKEAAGRLCTLRAVPAGTIPSNPSPFAGPLLATGFQELQTLPAARPNEGRPFGFLVQSVGLSAGSSSASIGRCGAGGFLGNAGPALATTTFECGGRLGGFDNYQETSASTRSQIQVDGIDVWAAATVDEQYGGSLEHFPAISYSVSQDPATGNTVIEDDETFAACSPTSCAPSGVRDSRTIATAEDGHLVTITDRWSSTDGEPHALDLLPQSTQAFGAAGARNGERIAYRFPGEGAYATHRLGDVVAFGDGSPSVIYVDVEGAPDGDRQTGRGAIVLDRPASPATFDYLTEERSGFELHQTATVPASGSTDFRTAYVQGYTAAEVEALVAKVESAFAPPAPPHENAPPSTSKPPAVSPQAPPPRHSIHTKVKIHITKVKLDVGAGTAILSARVDGPGRIVISGKGIVRAQTRSGGVGVVKLAVRAKGGARRHLNAIGKARVRAKLRFLAAEGGQARTSRTLVLRKRAPRRP